jgi:diguanylate cyclase (GGDEF)-like protein
LLALATAAAALLLAADRELARRRARREAATDPLTGLGNRRALARAWHRCRTPPRLLFIDLVGFKAVNDTHGHAAGDRLLVAVARRLGSACGRGVTLVRFGGDEFVAIDPAGSLGIARIARALQAPFDLPGLPPVRLGARIGLASRASSLEDALQRAGAAAMVQGPFNGAAADGPA